MVGGNNYNWRITIVRSKYVAIIARRKTKLYIKNKYKLCVDSLQVPSVDIEHLALYSFFFLFLIFNFSAYKILATRNYYIN